MQAIILLAGVGSRLKPLTNNTHKALINISGESLLKRQVRQLSTHGVKDFYLVVGHRQEDIRKIVASELTTYGNFVFCHNSDFAQTNTGYSLFLGMQALKQPTPSGGFIFIDGDLIVADKIVAQLPTASESFLACDSDVVLDDEALKVIIDPAGNLISLGKGLDVAHAHKSAEFIGIGHLSAAWSKSLLSLMTRIYQDNHSYNVYYEDIMHRLITSHKAPTPLKCFDVKDSWVEIDDHADLDRARGLF